MNLIKTCLYIALIVVLRQISASAQVLGSEEQKLFDLINAYRKQNGLPAIPHSPSLTKVAQLHCIDLADNLQKLTHAWSGCDYDAGNINTYKCMWLKPQELTDYRGYGYECAYGGYTATAESALNGWKTSNPHNAVILNEGIWRDNNWRALGVGIYKGYSTIWFGEEPEPNILSEPVTSSPKKSEILQNTTIQTNANIEQAKKLGRIKAAFVLGISGNYIHNETNVDFDSLQDMRFFGSLEGILGLKFGIKRQRSVFGIYGSTALFTSSDSTLFDKWEYGEKYATQMEYGLGFIHRGWIGVMLGYGHRGRSSVFAVLPSYYTFANLELSIPIRRFAIGVSGKVVLEKNGFYVRNIQNGAHLRFTL